MLQKNPVKSPHLLGCQQQWRQPPSVDLAVAVQEHNVRADGVAGSQVTGGGNTCK